MNKETLVKRLEELWDYTDTEMAHGHADELLLKFINSAKVRKAFDSVPKWYA